MLDALRERMWAGRWLVSRVLEGQEAGGEKFRDWFDHARADRGVPSHRALALFRGRPRSAMRWPGLSGGSDRHLAGDGLSTPPKG
ncbi:MAG: hypothetical protein AMXMBFR52_25240 [Burkholderiales bacterium]